MDFLKLINNILINNGYNSTFIPSYCNSQTARYESYIFHHIKKCGGMSIHGAIDRALFYGINIGCIENIYSARFDKDDEWDLFLRSDIYKSNYPFFISSHNIGDYYNLFHNIKRFTVFREPFERAKSEYQYNCMRNGIQPNIEDFELYIFSELSLKDYLQPFMPYKKNVSESEILDILDSDFEAFFELNDINKFLSYFLGKNNLPNIVIDIQNKTMDKYKLIDTNNIKTKYNEQDTVETRIFEWVKKNKRLPNNKNMGQLHSHTIVLHSNQTEEEYSGRSTIFKTEDFVKYIKAVKSNSGLGIFFPSM